MRNRGIEGLGFSGSALICAAVLFAALDQASAQSIAASTGVKFIDAPNAVLADPAWDGAAYTAKPTAMSNLGAFKLGEINSGPLNLKLSVAPQFSVSDIRGVEQRSGGAEIRLGSNNAPGVEPDRSWFLFAGQKGRAVTWNMDRSSFDVDDLVQLKRRATVGDFQAGLAYQLGPTQMSLGYVKRTYSSGFIKDRTNIAAFSIAWRH